MNYHWRYVEYAFEDDYRPTVLKYATRNTENVANVETSIIPPLIDVSLWNSNKHPLIGQK